MSRAYRIAVKETLSKVIRAEDHVSTQLEMLDILPADQMSDLLAEQLVQAGFVREGNSAVRRDRDVVVSVDLESGTVTVTSEKSRNVSVTGQKAGRSYDQQGSSAKQVRENLRDSLAKDLQQDVSDREKDLQRQVTDQLESELAGLRRELDQAVNKATAQALKQKAAQIGQIKELTEDPESGSLTIVVEV